MPIITLTTDFGLSDHYVAAMKGVILGICPRARIVDVTHDVTPFAITEGAYLIFQAWRTFPKKTVHVVVVDPGVGTARRPILMEAAGQYFIAPDNGVLSMIYLREPHKIRLIENDRLFRHPVSRTFHGRDLFAPCAAHLATGVTPAQFGKRIEDYLKPAFQMPIRAGKRAWTGQILQIDHFGNIITNFHVEDFPNLENQDVTFSVGPQPVSVIARNYAETGQGELFAIVGSSGFYEISINQASAARRIGCVIGGPVELFIGSPVI